jgi:hypothetical protein
MAQLIHVLAGNVQLVDNIRLEGRQVYPVNDDVSVVLHVCLLVVLVTPLLRRHHLDSLEIELGQVR